MIALFSDVLWPTSPPSTAAPTSRLTFTVGAVLTGAAVIPAWLGFAEPVRRGAVVTAWLKSIGSVFLCGALIAVANWIYTLCSLRWTQAGLPMIPPISVKPGGGAFPLGAATATASGPSPGQTATSQKTSWMHDMYKD